MSELPAVQAHVTLPPGVDSQVNETLPWARILALAAGAMVLFLVGAVFAVLMFVDVHGQANEHDQRPGLAVGEGLIGMVSQNVVELDTGGAALHAAEEKKLNAWGWSNKAKGEVHMPIDIAIDRYLESKQ